VGASIHTFTFTRYPSKPLNIYVYFLTEGEDFLEITVVLSGDPRRARLCERVADWYKKISMVKDVLLLYERNPAIAFNKGARIARCDLILCAGGDVIVTPPTLSKMVSEVKEGEVLFLVSEKFRGKKKILFQSGAFCVYRTTLIKHPIPEKPDFLEEVYWTEEKELKFKPFFGELYHIHRHSFAHICKMSIYRWRERVRLRKRSSLVFYVGCLKLFFESIRIYLEERRKRIDILLETISDSI